MIKNCEKCFASYEPYTPGKASDIFGSWCLLNDEGSATKGLCSFCNPKGVFYNKLPLSVV